MKCCYSPIEILRFIANLQKTTCSCLRPKLSIETEANTRPVVLYGPCGRITTHVHHHEICIFKVLHVTADERVVLKPLKFIPHLDVILSEHACCEEIIALYNKHLGALCETDETICIPGDMICYVECLHDTHTKPCHRKCHC